MGYYIFMKTFAAALMCMTVYGTQVEASTELTTGATAEIAAAVESNGYGKIGYGDYSNSYSFSQSYSYSVSYDSYSSDYSHSDYHSSDYSDHDYGFGYRRRYGNRIRYFRYQPRYYSNHYYYGRRYASRLGAYNGVYRSYGYRSYGYGYRGNHGGYRRYGGHYYGRRGNGLW